MRVEVRNNNVDKAIRILKKKLTEEGMFNELREREFYEWNAYVAFVLYDYEYEETQTKKEVEVSFGGRTSTRKVSKKDGRV